MDMRIERVDDKTVKCFLSNEELQEYDIDYKDFVMRSEKAKEVVQDIMEQATEEVGYKPPKFAFDMQIMMVPDQGMVLTLSEKDALDLENNAQLLQCLKDMKEIVQRAREACAGENSSDSVRKEEEALPGSEQHGAVQKDSDGQKDTKAQQAARPDFVVFTFENLRSVMELANVLPGNLRVNSALYEMNNLYYLYLQKGSASYERYSRTCIQAMEFGSLYAMERGRVLHLAEHGQCLISEKALKKLRMN